jgi:hypothetical protein
LTFYLDTTLVQVVGFSDQTHCGFMVTTRSQHYRSPSPASSQGRSSDLLDVEPVVAPDEAFQSTLAWGTVTRSHVFWMRSFDKVKEEIRDDIWD